MSSWLSATRRRRRSFTCRRLVSMFRAWYARSYSFRQGLHQAWRPDPCRDGTPPAASRHHTSRTASCCQSRHHVGRSGPSILGCAGTVHAWPRNSAPAARTMIALARFLEMRKPAARGVGAAGSPDLLTAERRRRRGSHRPVRGRVDRSRLYRQWAVRPIFTTGVRQNRTPQKPAGVGRLSQVVNRAGVS